MPTSSSRLGLVQPASSDQESLWPSQFLTNTTGLLDNSVLISQGTLAARPATPSPNVSGQTYYATDTTQWFFWNGSAWNAIHVEGAWQALTLGTGVSAGGAGYTPSAQLVGSRVFLKGEMTGSSITAWATIPAALRPSNTVSMPAAGSGTNAVNLTITTGGAVTSSVAQTLIYLDGVNYSLS